MFLAGEGVMTGSLTPREAMYNGDFVTFLVPILYVNIINK